MYERTAELGLRAGASLFLFFGRALSFLFRVLRQVFYEWNYIVECVVVLCSAHQCCCFLSISLANKYDSHLVLCSILFLLTTGTLSNSIKQVLFLNYYLFDREKKEDRRKTLENSTA